MTESLPSGSFKFDEMHGSLQNGSSILLTSKSLQSKMMNTFLGVLEKGSGNLGAYQKIADLMKQWQQADKPEAVKLVASYMLPLHVALVTGTAGVWVYSFIAQGGSHPIKSLQWI